MTQSSHGIVSTSQSFPMLFGTMKKEAQQSMTDSYDPLFFHDRYTWYDLAVLPWYVSPRCGTVPLHDFLFDSFSSGSSQREAFAQHVCTPCIYVIPLLFGRPSKKTWEM